MFTTSTVSGLICARSTKIQTFTHIQETTFRNELRNEIGKDSQSFLHFIFSMVIYEVNVYVDASAKDEFLEFLDMHAKQLLEIKGFLTADVYIPVSERLPKMH